MGELRTAALVAAAFATLALLEIEQGSNTAPSRSPAHGLSDTEILTSHFKTPSPAAPTQSSLRRRAEPQSDLPSSIDSLSHAMSENLFEVSRCAAACLDAVAEWSMPASVTMDEQRSLSLIYNSRQAFVALIVEIYATPSANLAVPEAMSMRVSINGGLAQHLDGGGVTEAFYTYSDVARSAHRLGFQFDANSYATGAYPYTAYVRFWRSGVSVQDSIKGRVLIVRRDSTYGWGWAPAGVQQLKIAAADSSVMIWDGDGSAWYFQRVCSGSCTYQSREVTIHVSNVIPCPAMSAATVTGRACISIRSAAW